MKNLFKNATKATVNFVKNHKVFCGVTAVVGIAGACAIYMYNKGAAYRKEALDEIHGGTEDIDVDISQEEVDKLKEEKTEEK